MIIIPELHFNRILAVILPDYNVNWILGDEDNANAALTFKAIEGTTEAFPQLVLQLYIIARKGLCLSKTGGKKRERELFPTY